MGDEEQEVQFCGREAQIFAMNLMMELSQDSMQRLQRQFEEKEIHVSDVCCFLSNIYHFLIFFCKSLLN